MDKADLGVGGEEKEFSFRHKFETCIRHPSEESNGAKVRSEMKMWLGRFAT